MTAATAEPTERRPYHTTRMLGLRAFCPKPACRGWGEPTGTKVVDEGRRKVQQRRCVCCGTTFSVVIDLRQESRDMD